MTRFISTLKVTAVCLIASLAFVASAQAEAPMVKYQAPGYYRMMLGNFEVTALSDGTVSLPVEKLLLNITPKKVEKALDKRFLSSPVQTSVNGFLINTGSRLVLIDAGAGSLFGPTLGKLIYSLQASGYQASDVDDIYITHMHPDHVGGLVSDGRIVFPNATVHARQADVDYWLSEDNLKAAPDSAKGFFKGAMASINPYIKAGQFKAFEGDAQLMPGIQAIAAPGHTPGHSMYKIQSDGHTLTLWGDIVHVAAVQFPKPSVAIAFDTDSKEAVIQRKQAFAEAARHGELVGAAHLSFPGLGHLKEADQGYTFVPVNYTAAQ